MARIEQILAKGRALSARDVADIETELALMPLDQAHEQEPWIWGGVALIVHDPDYTGDAVLP